MTGSFHLIQLIVNIKSSGTIQLAVILRMKKKTTAFDFCIQL